MKRVEHSKALCALRSISGLTQEELSEKLNISWRWYQEIEAGRRSPGEGLTDDIISFFQNYDFEKEGVHSVGYMLVEEKMCSPDLGEYTTYGIRVIDHDLNELDCIHDISADRKKVKRLADLCNRREISLIHFRDVVEDLVNSIE